jgi:hypothetical protein
LAASAAVTRRGGLGNLRNIPKHFPILGKFTNIYQCGGIAEFGKVFIHM